jgi:hypothetical protein
MEFLTRNKQPTSKNLSIEVRAPKSIDDDAMLRRPDVV